MLVQAFCASALVLLLSLPGSLALPVTSLPGFNGPLPGPMYSGYITVDESTGRQIYYMFFPSYNNPTTDPLSLWLTGGPGCSGLIAAFSENGPYSMNFTANGTGLIANPYTWVNVMNMIYIESPVGVGFSNVPGATTYSTGDAQTADDSYHFMLAFYEQFPQFKSNNFWITGESYGGHYVPELANRILDGNAAANATGDFVIPLKGWMVGNPWTDPEVEAFGVVENWWDRAIISPLNWETIKNTCSFKDITFWIINNASAGSLRTPDQRARWWHHHLKEARKHGDFLSGDSEKCFAALNLATNIEFGGVDILDVFRDMCVPGVQQMPGRLNPCAAEQMGTYLNIPEVRAAIHASPSVPATWSACSAPPTLTYSTLDTQTSVRPIYERALRERKLHILVFSGDTDAIVPFTGTRKWIALMERPVVRELHQWFANTNGNQVAGWSTQYEGFTFATVRGAGHMVPYTEPQRALHMIRTFLANFTL